MPLRSVPLGSTGESVTALCLGTMYFGTTVDEPTSVALLDHYVEAGGSFLDTANCYAFWEGDGHESETLLGRYVVDRDCRDDLFLATKVGFAPERPGAPWPDEVESLTATRIVESVETSLRRLRTDRIDLLYAHRDDRDTPLDETLEAFARLVEAGKVRHLGASNTRSWRLERARATSRARGWPAYACVQQKYTYLRPRPGVDFGGQLWADDDVLDYTRSEGLSLLAYSPLLSGAYTRADRPIPPEFAGPNADARLAVLAEVAEETGATPNQVVLAWMLAQGILPIVAASTAEQLAENLGAAGLALTDDHVDRLDAASAIAREPA
ncbi:aldo/keto reductase [Rubrivirga sp.]|uniref:aldo/keto reductase n=1 Tax=Rubrivirga sp. TaxID=1885344 RepID=UPI003B51A578